MQLTEQQKEAQQELQASLEKMLFEVKRKLKSNSKNELIRTICALLVDNYALKVQVQSLQPTEGGKNENTVG